MVLLPLPVKGDLGNFLPRRHPIVIVYINRFHHAARLGGNLDDIGGECLSGSRNRGYDRSTIAVWYGDC